MLTTTLYFEKPELYPNPSRCIRWDTPWPIGYVDDGAEHVPRAIHSIRVPRPPGGQRLVLNDIKVLHYSFCRPDAHRAVAVDVEDAAVLRRNQKCRQQKGTHGHHGGDLTGRPDEWQAKRGHRTGIG